MEEYVTVFVNVERISPPFFRIIFLENTKLFFSKHRMRFFIRKPSFLNEALQICENQQHQRPSQRDPREYLIEEDARYWTEHISNWRHEN